MWTASRSSGVCESRRAGPSGGTFREVAHYLFSFVRGDAAEGQRCVNRRLGSCGSGCGASTQMARIGGPGEAFNAGHRVTV